MALTTLLYFLLMLLPLSSCDVYTDDIGEQLVDAKLNSGKLQNPDVLKQLDFKLHRPQSIQQQQLWELIFDFSHLFSGVPTKADVIYQEVDIGDALPIKQHPCRLKPVKAK